MLTITNNQQTPNFQAQMKMGKASTKLGQYLKNKKINPNAALLTSAGAAGAAGSIVMFSPDAVSAPDAAKWAIGGGMASTLGLMGFSHLKPKMAEAKAETETKLEAETEIAVEENPEVADASENVKEEVSTQSISRKLYEVESPIGKIKLSEAGKKAYMDAMDTYSAGKAKRDANMYVQADAEEKIIKSKLIMEVLQSLHELSTSYANVISSATFGQIKVTEKGLKEYLELIDLYSKGKAKRDANMYVQADAEEKINIAKAKINIIKGFGQL